jgi:hypothetical protein
MADGMVSAAELALRRDLAAGRFVSGACAGRWALLDIAFPYAMITVRASDGIDYGFRFECRDYPRLAVTAQPWDMERRAPLDVALWPAGESRIPLAFNPGWKGGTCLYLPCDRQAIEGHDQWMHTHPALLWEPPRGICKYLGIIHELLNSPDYRGRRAA